MRMREARRGVLIAVLALSAVWLLSLLWGLAGKANIAITQANQTKAQYADLEARRAKLQADLNTLQTPRGQDAAIREAFGVAKSGEEVIVVVPPAVATSSPPETWWQRVLDWF